MLTVAILAENSSEVYVDVPADVFAEISHSLSGLAALPVSGPISILPTSALGACLCTSFSQALKEMPRRMTDARVYECKDCGHDTHFTRVHCGVMVGG